MIFPAIGCLIRRLDEFSGENMDEFSGENMDLRSDLVFLFCYDRN